MTAVRPVARYGKDVEQAFKPFTLPRKIQPSAIDNGPGYHAAMSGITADPTMIHLTNDSEFVSGGWHRGTALKGITMQNGELLSDGTSSLGSPFLEYLKKFDAKDLEEMLDDFHNGLDVERDINPQYLETVFPTDPTKLKERLHRKPHLRNSKTVDAFAKFAAEQITAWLRSGAIEHLGTVEECMLAGTVPLVIGTLTVEPTKPRLCCNCSELNKNTRKRDVILEGLHDVQEHISNEAKQTTYACIADEKGAYLHTNLRPRSRLLLGFALFGRLFQYTHPPFGWTNSCQLHCRNGMVYSGYHRHCGGYVT